MALVVFAIEIMINAMVQVDFKYSFFFWLDIIATVSLIPDIPWIADVVGYIVLGTPNYLSVNAVPGVMVVQSAASAKIQKLVSAVRLIRLVRIIKLYKYISQSRAKSDDNKAKEDAIKRAKILEDQADTTNTEDDEQQSLFM